MGSPLVSCLCVSQPCRWGQLQRSIIDFNNQGYADRELLIAVDNASDYPSMVESFVDSITLNAKVRVLPRVVKCQLEGLQHAAICAFGSVLTIWDDDNLNHPDRLAMQVDRQTRVKTAITVLSEGMYYFHEDSELFVLGCERPDAQRITDRTLPTTVMGYRDTFPLMDHTVRSRPTDGMMMNAARSGRKITSISGLPFLHVVGVSNDAKCPSTRTYEYHRSTIEKSGRPVEWITSRTKTLTEALDKFQWDKDVAVEGRDGGAFAYTPKCKWPDTLYPVSG